MLSSCTSEAYIGASSPLVKAPNSLEGHFLCFG